VLFGRGWRVRVCAGAGLLMLSLGGGDVRVWMSWSCFCALARVCFDPNMLANGAMVTTDVGPRVVLWRRCIALSILQEAGMGEAGLAGVALGLALSAKYTGIFLVPMLVVVVVLEGVMARDWRVLWRRVGRWS